MCSSSTRAKLDGRRCQAGAADRPWLGYYELLPLPGLFAERDWVADLSQLFPALPDELQDKRIACLTRDFGRFAGPNRAQRDKARSR